VYSFNSGAAPDLLSLLTALPIIKNASLDDPQDMDTLQVLTRDGALPHTCMHWLLLHAPSGLAEGLLHAARDHRGAGCD
jgi:hypothetical protein